MDELLEQFLLESRDLIVEAASHFGALGRNPQATASIDGAFRAIHTLKGSVALFALKPAECVLHAAEDLLERARKGTSALDAGTITALVACLDQIDRWVDEFEISGALSDAALALAEVCLAPLSDVKPGTHFDGAGDIDAAGAWVDGLMAREADTLANTDRALTAFRYRPDPDCFFRGDDPLATIQAVPDLVAVAILPHDGHWPDVDTIEPFACFTVLEGLSGAPFDAVRAAFRMMPDQVVFAVVNLAQDQGNGSATPNEITINRSFRVDSARVDALGDTVGELLVAIHGFHALAIDAERIDRMLAAKARAYHANLERVAGALQLSLSAVRSVPLEQGLRRLPRLIREIAESLGKSVEFAIVGQDLEVDRQVADGIFEPLLHLVRNAIDHGIESQEQRRASGKSPIGKITLRFHRERDLIVGELADDGVGIDADTLRQVAVERGLVTAAAADALNDAAALRLIFLPGFSTARAVTVVSGRGIGMDAVQAAVVRLRGSIALDSDLGVGTRFRIAFPATTLTTRLLVIEAGGDRYGIALDQIVETVGMDTVKLSPISGGTACMLRGRTMSMLDLSVLLGGADASRRDGKLVVIRAGGEPVALRVDAFGERIDIVVRPASGMLAQIPGVMGSALMRDGDVLLVLDLQALAS